MIKITLVSVVIPTRNRKEYLTEALESVRNQSYEKIEVIIIDGNSSDGTRKYLGSLEDNIELIFHDEPKGQSIARNKGIKEANGEYIFFLDDDDVLYNETIEKMVNTMESTPDNCVGVFAGEKRFGDVDKIHEVSSGKIKNTFNLDFGTSCSMFKTETLREIEGFDECLNSSEDLDLVIRIFSRGYCIFGISEPLYKRRIHERQISKRYNENISAYREILDKHEEELSIKEKLEWNRAISWSYNKLGQDKAAANNIQNSIKLLKQNITQLNNNENYYCFKAISHQYQELDTRDLAVTGFDKLLETLNDQQKNFQKTGLLYAKLGFNFAEIGESKKSRNCLKKSIKRKPDEIYKYYFYFWLLFGKKGYKTGRKLEKAIKKN